jgi:hypothetical protein
MEFKTEAQKQVYEKITPWMKEIFGEFAVPRENLPNFGIRIGSAYSQVAVTPWGDDDATICAFSWVVTGPEMNADLMRFLLKANYDMRFGAFGVDEAGDICFSQTIVGSTCDKEELKATVMAVINIADEYDDKIIAQWGGLRAADRK